MSGLSKSFLTVVLVSMIASASFSGKQDVAYDDELPGPSELVPIEVVAEMKHISTPVYPASARQSGLEGLVWIKALVGRDGFVWDAGIFWSSGHVELDWAALEAAPQCRFNPAKQGGQPVAMWVAYKVEFTLEGSKRRKSPVAAFQVSSRISEDVYPLWQSVDGEPQSRSTLPSDKTAKIAPSARDSDSVAAIEQGFDMLTFRQTDRSRRGKQRALALINGGCANGLQVGMKGFVWEEDGDKRIKLGSVQIQDVRGFESLCLIKARWNRIVTSRHRVFFEQPEPTPPELLSRGIEFYDAGLFEYAQACFESLSYLADSNALVSARLQECRLRSVQEVVTMAAEDYHSLQRRIPSHLRIAECYIRLNDAAGAWRHLSKVMAVDSSNARASELNEVLDLMSVCEIDIADIWSGQSDSAAVDSLPKLIQSRPAWPRLPPAEYYYDNRKGRAQDEPDVVWVQALVSTTGRVVMAAVLSSSGMERLDRAAVEEAYRATFEPGTICGKPAPIWMKWKTEFTRKRF